jgi:competence protein ComEA
MSETSTPWRALEEAPAATAVAGSRNGGPKVAEIPRQRLSWWIVGTVGLAALVLVAAVALVLSAGQGTVAVEGEGAGGIRQSPRESGGLAAAASVSELVIDVQGAVPRPGIVRLPNGARVADAIAAAGGYGPRVAADRVAQALNLAAAVHDGDQVVVPSRDDPASASIGPRGSSGGPSGSGAGGADGGSGPVDLNRASATELDALPGIGPVSAAKIIAAREEQPFASLDELRTRNVLGAATLEKIKDLVVVR